MANKLNESEVRDLRGRLAYLKKAEGTGVHEEAQKDVAQAWLQYGARILDELDARIAGDRAAARVAKEVAGPAVAKARAETLEACAKWGSQGPVSVFTWTADREAAARELQGEGLVEWPEAVGGGGGSTRQLSVVITAAGEEHVKGGGK